MAKRRVKSLAQSNVVRATPERATHGEVVAVGPAQRVRDGIDALLAQRQIGTVEVAASDRWYRDYALAVHGARDPVGGIRSGEPSGYADARLAASISYDAARAAVGARGDAALRVFVGGGVSLRAASPGNRDGQSYLAGLLSATLGRLVEHYATIDGARA